MPSTEHFLIVAVIGVALTILGMSDVIGSGTPAVAAMGIGFLLLLAGFFGGAFSVAR